MIREWVNIIQYRVQNPFKVNDEAGQIIQIRVISIHLNSLPQNKVPGTIILKAGGGEVVQPYRGAGTSV
jgi:hypothetical protein